MDLQSEYDSATSGINTFVSNQLSSALTWSNIPGTLSKVSASGSGHVWGMTRNALFVCEAPCNGDWQAVDIGNKSSEQKLLLGPANSKNAFTMISSPKNVSQIFSTNTYIWAQDSSNKKYKCAKPCTTGNWIEVPDTNVTITSSNDTTLFGRDLNSKALKTDESMRNPWSEINGLTGLPVSNLVGNTDSTNMYAVNAKSGSLYKCEGDCVDPKALSPVDTAGHSPFSLTPDIENDSIWMTSTTEGDKGNIFNRLEKNDYTTVMNNLMPFEQRRDKVVSKIEDEYNQQTKSLTSSQQVSSIVDFVRRNFNFDTKGVQDDSVQVNQLQKQVKDVNSKLDNMKSTEKLIQTLLIVVAIVAVIYLIAAPILGSLVHTVAFIVLIGGLGYAIYSSGNQ